MIRSRVVVVVAALSMAVAAACEPPAPPAVAPLRPDQQPLKVMVVGDSFGMTVWQGLDRYGTDSGQLIVRDEARVGCPFGRGGRNRGAGLDREWPPECRSQDARLLTAVAEFRPDVVVLAGGMWDASDRLLEGMRTWTHVGQPRYDLYLAGEFRHLSAVVGATGAKVVWTTAPTWRPVYDPSIFMGPPPYPEATPGRSDRYNDILRRSVADLPNVSILELAWWLRSRPGGEFAPDLRPDGAHLTRDASVRLATEWLGPWLVAIGRG